MNDLAKASILIIDNDEGVVRAISARLSNLGYECSVARTGAQGLSAFADEPIDLVITDLNMPVLDGMGLVEKIREFSEVPIIVVTGYRKEYHDQINQMYDISVLEKPFSTESLLEMVDLALGSHRLRRAG